MKIPLTIDNFRYPNSKVAGLLKLLFNTEFIYVFKWENLNKDNCLTPKLLVFLKQNKVVYLCGFRLNEA